ncbi:MAG TPA: ASCH domain-containing protein [Candidatus Paceibacterota bacterium]|nr:ASCH domain-containing protein [Candidatus Paceibacterota bacterium]HMO82721.1 ASCH domain-containing protein [Candidatus Paceibacterota bacterium]
MKTLKFFPELCEQILAGTKTTTWRLFDDKDLQIGDELVFVNKETLEQFGTGKITSLRTKTLRTLVESDWNGHERYASAKEMYATYRKYYGDRVTPDTEVKIINFDFIKN